MRNSEIVRKIKKSLVKEFYRLAKQPAHDPMAALSEPAALRRLWLICSDKVIALESTVTAQAPKVAAFDRIKLADGLTSILDAAKALGVSERKILIPWLLQHRWRYRRPGTNKLMAIRTK
ncbi:phage antirepressor KilAC domain-containing protein [Propionivibrio sp.]|uniref:phage antirepressor KilAC domain-containing protein n=1 Tax=Propionivibrio sp. TaxID=2212460 RepID=UPI003BF0D217